MNAPFIHLTVNHFPVILVPTGLALLLAGWRKNSRDLLAASCWIFFAAGAFTLASVISGEASHEVLHKLVPGISHAAIAAHEEAAEVAAIGSGLLAILALTGLLRFDWGKMYPRWFIILALAGSLAVTGLMGWTAKLGGEIRHTETASAGETARHR